MGAWDVFRGMQGNPTRKRKVSGLNLHTALARVHVLTANEQKHLHSKLFWRFFGVHTVLGSVIVVPVTQATVRMGSYL